MALDKAALGAMLRSVAALWQQNCERLSEIDSKFGDGDHGVTIGKIARLLEAEVTAWDDTVSIHDFLENLGDKIMAIGGGSAGPLYGTMVGGLAEPLTDETILDAPLLRRMLQGSRDAMFDISTARVGDKTMMDALLPAVEAATAFEGDEPAALLAVAAQAAAAGAKASEGMISKFGRAKSYKEQTIGTPDAGAISTALFFEGLAKAL